MKKEVMIETIEKAADKVFVPLTVGGGIRKIDNQEVYFWRGLIRFQLILLQ